MDPVEELKVVRKIIFELLEDIKKHLLKIAAKEETSDKDIQEIIDLIDRYIK